jgi:hypothetical protein
MVQAAHYVHAVIANPRIDVDSPRIERAVHVGMVLSTVAIQVYTLRQLYRAYQRTRPLSRDLPTLLQTVQLIDGEELPHAA